jgi:phosphatidylserine/phosphatidylglycerophosphate/cardiolipin synthase-like enzyme
VRWYSHDGLAAIRGNGPLASHTKYATIDGQVSIVGTANMETQSWNNAREVNIVVDDAATTKKWDEQLFEADWNKGIPVEQCKTQ